MSHFSDVYDEYANQVYRYLLSLTRDDETAEELTQETFYRALLHIHQFRGTCSMYSWLCQIGKNLFFNEQKKQKFLGGELPESITAQDTLEHRMMDREQIFLIHQVLHDLQEPYKEVFSLRIFGELKFSEIASLFEKTESWAKVTFFRAKMKIIQKMEENK